MEVYFATMFEDVRLERSLILLLPLTDPNKLRKSKFTDYKIDFIKNLAVEKLQRQRILKEHCSRRVSRADGGGGGGRPYVLRWTIASREETRAKRGLPP